MKILLFTDLDDTLFTSVRKAPPETNHRIAASLESGDPVSYASPLQQQWLAHWQQHATIIPVTARNHAAYRRVHLPFRAHAILNYGGTILNPDGSPDTDWQTHNAAHAAHSTPRLQTLAHSLAGQRTDLNIRLIADHGITYYLLVKSRSGAALDDIAAHLRNRLDNGEQLHHNGNNLAVLPAWLDKANAVARLQQYYRARHGEILTLGMGDSLIDLAFMQQCDYLIAPQNSQITRTLRRQKP